MSNEDKEFIKMQAEYSVFASFWSYSYNSGMSFTKNKQLAFNLINNKNIVIQKSDKGILFDKDKYFEGVSKVLNNNYKSEMFKFDHDKEFRGKKNRFRENTNVLKDLKKEDITEVIYNHANSCGSHLGVLYDLALV